MKAETPVADLSFELAQATDPVPAAEATHDQAAAPALTPAHVESALASIEDEREPGEAFASDAKLSFGEHLRSVRTEMIAAVGYMTAVNVAKIVGRGEVDSFSFHDEGLFEKDTRELGMDKLVHAHNTYVLSELIGARIRKNTGTTRGTAASGAVLATGLMLYSEIYDGFKAGFGFYDLAFNSLGAGFSILRQTTPGLEEKLDFRVLIIPNRQIYSPTGREHYRQLRYLFALKLDGFEALESTPLRFFELHAGYYGKGFTEREQERGAPLERKLFAGIGLNISHILFGKSPRTRVGRAGAELLDFWQPPYTYIHAD